jgi:hypothetical protein
LLLNVTPAFEGDALKDGQEGIEKIVEVGYSIVRVFGTLAAEIASGASSSYVSANQIVRVNHSSLDCNTPRF